MAGTRNTLMDLNNHLFQALERLDDDSLSMEELDKEIKRSEAVQKVASSVIANANLILKAYQVNDGRIDLDRPAPRILIGDGND